MRGFSGAKVEIGSAKMIWNFTRITNVLGTPTLTNALDHAWWVTSEMAFEFSVSLRNQTGFLS
jgi:hypothetical protein